MYNFIFFLASCPEQFELLKIIYFVKLIIKIILFIVPMGVILMTAFDLFKNVAASNESDMKKNVSIAIKRIFYCVCIFFVPTIVGLVSSILGDLGVDYANYIACANLDDIEIVIENTASDLVSLAANDLKYSSYSDAVDVVSKIKDDDLRSKYESQLKSIKDQIDQGRPSDEEIVIVPGSSGSNKVEYSDDVIENLASFIGSEAGGHPEGFLGQLMTGAVYINNYHKYIGSIDNANTESMCKMFSWTNPTAYTPDYCYYTFDKLEANRGYIPDSHVNQLTIVAEILLSKEFTIPTDVRFQAADWIINKYGTIWGVTPTGLSGYWGYFGYRNEDAPLKGVDVYGNTVSTNFADYKEIAENLYKKYLD